MHNTINNEQAALMANTLHSNHDHPTKTEPKDYPEYDSVRDMQNVTPNSLAAMVKEGNNGNHNLMNTLGDRSSTNNAQNTFVF
mmetsp:Transcript_13585/g.17204  ORF Transcript_13585/g.17204 Transcript_13585/m.17204 type:complete len:83 (-) Transcript_13585:134-382(-)